MNFDAGIKTATFTTLRQTIEVEANQKLCSSLFGRILSTNRELSNQTIFIPSHAYLQGWIPAKADNF